MNLSQYEALIKAVETGTMTQAAEDLGYTQSGLTRALNSLEEQWNVRLLNRGRNGVQLTPEGQLLLPYIRTVLHDQRRLSEFIDEGHFRIADAPLIFALRGDIHRPRAVFCLFQNDKRLPLFQTEAARQIFC